MTNHFYENILKADTEAIVNTVNCVGVMGKGLALQFKKAYPEMFLEYQQACKSGECAIGKVWIWEIPSLINPKYVMNFPTKNDWRNASTIEYIKSGLVSLVQELNRLKIKSVSIPMLGCRNGGLAWSQVQPLITEAFAGSDIDVHLYVNI